ncbi:MAG: hypothetical protein OEZ06_05145 [Myxococcales bacterium]|nr:hypothetical protein [Myxococcales bacterium]
MPVATRSWVSLSICAFALWGCDSEAQKVAVFKRLAEAEMNAVKQQPVISDGAVAMDGGVDAGPSDTAPGADAAATDAAASDVAAIDLCPEIDFYNQAELAVIDECTLSGPEATNVIAFLIQQSVSTFLPAPDDEDAGSTGETRVADACDVAMTQVVWLDATRVQLCRALCDFAKEYVKTRKAACDP